MYDTLHVGGRTEQVKLWGKGLGWFHLGDRVGPPRGGLAPGGDYTVVMSTGGFVHVRDGVVVAWADSPGAEPVVDTRGEAVDLPPAGVVRLTAAADRRTAALLREASEPCPVCVGPAPRPQHLDRSGRSLEEARAAADREVGAFLAGRPDDAARVEAARALLADRQGYALVKAAAAARLLGLDQDSGAGAELLVALLRGTRRGAPELQGLALLVELEAARLPAPALVQALRLLSGFLPTAEEEAAERAQEPAWQRDEVSHPLLRRRRAAVALSSPEGAQEHARAVASWLDQLGRLHVESAARAAVAHHGAAAVPGVACSLWGWDVVATRLVVQVLQARLGRELTADERAVAREALDDEPGFLDDLTDAQVEAALERAVARA